MTQQFTDRQGRAVVLEEITEDNWRDVADVAPTDEQRRYVAALAARYLLLSQRGKVWTSLGVRAGDDVVGHVMWAYDDEDGTHWIGGMVVSASEQGKGMGRATLGAVVERLSALPECREIRLSYHPDNTSAGRLYTSFGFQPTGDFEDEEIVLAIPAS
ncbi:GNAT family N-acetyltransferase [Streptomyces sp. WI04-05B]|uniref:GNAT family N-acetyltransferase n=1 Tax=Streptomyces TaxID=1883 RepID=UPI0029A5C66C|nr:MULTISPECIES: GNAT family N-acetyltransferase [unclassified Streptomyces]MDX2548272.1 GNAT family N-acetyltransferase [Streptomyces sp. WI04-05B]MDX2586648.1 GNAT family N-acetyltransferase [Streptomyces sp. WI04-05A]MDX3746254.1 GNAT family N-acetyltransferase [Streptomyces sp. AK08-02]